MNIRLRKPIRTAFAAALFLAAAFFLAPVRAAEIAELPAGLEFKTGQIIAISEMIEDPSTLLFEGFTGSRYGHVGVVAAEEDGLQVYHASPPSVQKEPLEAFLQRARTNLPGSPAFTAVELANPLTRPEQKALMGAMKGMVARVPYNYSMVMNDKALNCSEFVRKVFSLIGRENVGTPERLAEMNAESFDGLLKEVWLKSGGHWPSGDSLGVSPVAIVNSPNVKVVHTGLPVERISSDWEIYQAWKKGGGLKKFSQLTRIATSTLEKAARLSAFRKPYRPYPSSWRRRQRR